MYPSLALVVVREAHPQQHAVALGAFTGFYDLGTAIAGPAVAPPVHTRRPPLPPR